MRLNTGSSCSTEVKWPLFFVQVCVIEFAILEIKSETKLRVAGVLNCKRRTASMRTALIHILRLKSVSAYKWLIRPMEGLRGTINKRRQ